MTEMPPEQNRNGQKLDKHTRIPSFKEVKHRVNAALYRLRRRDAFLIQANTNERTISHKLAEYLQARFPLLKVDCEYNRHGSEIKKLEVPGVNINWDDTEARTVFPDIIVHQRNDDRSNLLVVEVKKSSNTQSRDFDKNKLAAFTLPPYKYRFGLLLEISMRESHDTLKWYAHGHPINERVPTLDNGKEPRENG